MNLSKTIVVYKSKEVWAMALTLPLEPLPNTRNPAPAPWATATAPGQELRRHRRPPYPGKVTTYTRNYLYIYI